MPNSLPYKFIFFIFPSLGAPASPNLYAFLLGKKSWRSKVNATMFGISVAVTQVVITVVIRLKVISTKSLQQGIGKLSNPLRNVNSFIALGIITYVLVGQLIGWTGWLDHLPDSLIYPRLGLGIVNIFILLTVLLFNEPAISFAKRKISHFFYNCFIGQNNKVEEIHIAPISILPYRTSSISPNNPVDHASIPGTLGETTHTVMLVLPTIRTI